MPYLDNSQDIVGYRVKIVRRDAFRVKGYTLIVPPGTAGEGAIPAFWRDVRADGRLAKLVAASSVRPRVRGLGSWDPECERGGQRYTICLEETPYTDLTRLEREYALFSKEIGASDWMCFEMTWDTLEGRFWRDDPYKMMKRLGYRFHAGDLSVGLHFETYPPELALETNPAVEFWITVVESSRRKPGRAD